MSTPVQWNMRARRCPGREPHDYQPWIDNDRRLRELLARLEALGAAALDADPRRHHKARHAPAETSQTTP